MKDYSRPSKGEIRRRDFLEMAAIGSASLVGTSFFTGRGWARPPAVRAGETVVPVRTHEHFGDLEEALAFPGDWEVSLQRMAGHGRAAMAPEEIRRRLDQPMDTPPLREIAAGKKTAVITFDDLTRPTPTQAVLRMIVDDLRAAGLRDDHILFLTSYGTHRAMTHAEAKAKLGDWVVGNFAWVNHNIWENVVEIGVTSQNNIIKVNHDFSKADVRITISGLKPHGTAGYGGGGKAVLPGVAWVESIDFFHRTITGLGTNKTVGVAKVFENDVRKDMEEAARLARVDFSVQIVYNENREPVEVFAGDIVTAHHAACRMVNPYFRTTTAMDADIVVVNAYPQNRQAISSLSWARRSLKDGGSVVLIAQHPDALSTLHYLHERWYYRGRPYWEMMEAAEKPVEQAGQILVMSQYMHRRDVNRFSARDVQLTGSWDVILEKLKKAHGSSTKVAVYPYAPLQHPELDLT